MSQMGAIDMGSIELRELASWDEFSGLVADIRKEFGYVQFGEDLEQKNTILFRGQSCAEWDLVTTLERRVDEPMSVQQYMIHASRCAPELESLTGTQWGVPDYPQIQEEIKTKQLDYQVHLPCYGYLVHLRHHGFPSPLLDWTESPYVAAYFAFDGARDADRVAIYIYVERAHLGKGGQVGVPMISSFGPFVRTNVRHFAQKCWYTIATQWDRVGEHHMFCEHSLVFDDGVDDQDILIKVTLPVTERHGALVSLADYNINHYTLFQTPDALVHALASKEFDLVPILRTR